MGGDKENEIPPQRGGGVFVLFVYCWGGEEGNGTKKRKGFDRLADALCISARDGIIVRVHLNHLYAK